MAIPLLIKAGALAGAAWLALRKKPTDAKPTNPPSGLPQAPDGPGGKEPVIGQRWTLWGVDLAGMVSETDDRFEGYYSSVSGNLIAVVDANTFDPSHTSAIVVRRDLAPDLPDRWD